MLKQVIVDMENQLIQVKTQVAMAIADEHLLSKKRKENETKHAEWMRKAELAIDKRDDGLARAAIERAETCRRTGEGLDQQLSEQRTQTESLRTALRNLEHKLVEARHKVDVLLAQHRRSRTAQRAAQAGVSVDNDARSPFDPRSAAASLNEETIEARFDALERNDRIDQLLAELKARRQSA
jgi:phage shock protein A